MRGKHVTVGTAIGSVLSSLGIGHKVEEYSAVTRWEQIVGEQIAKHASAVRIDNGVLVVQVDASVWRNELQVRKEELIARLNHDLGKDIVKDIKFK